MKRPQGGCRCRGPEDSMSTVGRNRNHLVRMTVVERSTFRGNRASATAADGRAVGGIGTGFFGASRTKLTRSRVTANTAKAISATGGLYQIAGNGDYELERTTVSTNPPVNCNFDCQR